MIYRTISCLINQALKTRLIEQADVIYTRNQLMAQLKLDIFPEGSACHDEETIPDLLEQLTAYAIEKGIIEDTQSEREIFSANIMNVCVARPSTIQAVFKEKYQESPSKATNYFYQLSRNSNYIQTKEIKKNINYKADTEYGKMDITINISKPEKDPKEIERERQSQPAEKYPACLLCMENEGYRGRLGHPARANHRVVQIRLLEENWYFQYSPYVYYPEHSILFAEEHRPMKINRKTFERLLRFTEKFPHYFIGSNADLPVVGGSILSHDHYQGGQYEFAMNRAENAFSFTLGQYPEVKASVLKWPLSVIRLVADTWHPLADAAEHIFLMWKSYSDEPADVLAETEGENHNSITPIARYQKGQFELDLVLRNNRTSDEHPYGIFHPHEDVHHIKKENIGLIEVMGLAVLPARLKEELEELEAYLLGESGNIKHYHKGWAEQLSHEYGQIRNKEQADEIIQKELGKKFVKALEDAAVFKDRSAFERFIETLHTSLARKALEKKFK
ncbi:galactose-1-phosphate uridylyltransferase [Sporosarcina globispora]|uniref:Galactose-1-phosphate uridylyltransferase n=1 Tax=Sporosarcina globispora TaxID=1459 RepID=A0A0M0GKS9_SPOGL|nr:UDP-glucose--hexose-1-phosphate uridylyltransferase [Sporosarcina globispora]KON90102.1 galactose-1-phosphate uridylyltransferase [Sporosarcina globispora]